MAPPKKPNIPATNDFEIGDVEDYRTEQDHKFSHQALVMECMRKCIETGSHEMRPGWFNEKVDNHGNTTRSYIEDTRKKFISSIKMLKAQMSCDIDTEAEKEIDRFEKELGEEKQKLLHDQTKWWNALTPKYRQIAAARGEEVKTNLAFNQDMVWFQHWVEEEVACYRAILESLVILTKRLDFYEAEVYEA